ncbi:MAG: hypothetical protein R6V07_09865 [Armatimonadota bacterium]
MRRVLLCMALLTLAGAAWAASVTTIPMNAWRVVDGDSVVRGDHLLLREESAVRSATSMDAGRIIMIARTTEERRQGVLTHLKLTYDDGAEETCDVRVPADTMQHEVTFAPQFGAWRRVVDLRLMHPADDMELLVTQLTAVAERPSMYLEEGGFPARGIIDREAMENGLLKVKWMAGQPVAQIAAPRSRQIIVLAAKVADSEWKLRSEDTLVLAALDRNGRVIKRYAEPLNGRVQPVLFYLHDLDLGQVDRLVFEAEGNADFAIRQIMTGGMLSDGVPPGKQKWGELEQINDRLEIVINIIEQGGDLPQQMIWQLKQLLLDYRRAE